ncbi:hypothetical protein [Microbacterium sp. XT11]|uniref:hypothetical protein n=1 Tax=Microbacterium sp. XT11 TaxID=367477 RepID=UPI000742D6CC|nr:hypothetical protein [Microbacterium sp. XT11]ALX67276.1 hypothetical protein AB663_003114 [Microbacterium sp. XT11]
MAMTSWPRVNEDTTDAQYAELFDSIIGTGIRGGTDLTVSADSSGLNVKVSSGFAVVAGSAFLSTATETLAIAPNTSGNPRVDLVALRRDFAQPTGQVVRLVVLQGTPAAAPVAPTATADVRGVYVLPLATVRVAAGAATITSADLTASRAYLSSRVSVWTTATRPTSQQLRFGFNTSTGQWETTFGGSWAPLVSWSTIPGKPAAIPITEGGTGATSAAAARANLGAAAASHSHAWTEITGKPTTFPPSAHTHPLSEGTGVLPIEKGGTGTTNAVAALQALGIFVQNAAPAHANGRVWIKRP